MRRSLWPRLVAAFALLMLGLTIAPAAQAAAGPTVWVVCENAKPGTAAWKIPPGAPRDIQGYADHVSAVLGADAWCSAAATTITRTVLTEAGNGPLGAAHPSAPNTADLGYQLTRPTNPSAGLDAVRRTGSGRRRNRPKPSW